MDQVGPDRITEEQDGAERAFEALRDEVAVLRRGIELVYRQAQEAREAVAGPDYSPTLGAIAQALQGIEARLEAVERTPALATTAGAQAAELRRVLQEVGEDARRGLAQSQGQLDGTVRALRGLIGAAHDRAQQRQWLWTAGGVGVLGGMLLWFLLTAWLPWGRGTALAGLAFGGRWNAGQAMLQEANPAVWDRMVRLYKACPQDSATELCEAVLAVRTIPPARQSPTMPAAPEGAKPTEEGRPAPLSRPTVSAPVGKGR